MVYFIVALIIKKLCYEVIDKSVKQIAGSLRNVFKYGHQVIILMVRGNS